MQMLVFIFGALIAMAVGAPQQPAYNYQSPQAGGAPLDLRRNQDSSPLPDLTGQQSFDSQAALAPSSSLATQSQVGFGDNAPVAPSFDESLAATLPQGSGSLQGFSPAQVDSSVGVPLPSFNAAPASAIGAEAQPDDFGFRVTDQFQDSIGTSLPQDSASVGAQEGFDGISQVTPSLSSQAGFIPQEQAVIEPQSFEGPQTGLQFGGQTNFGEFGGNQLDDQAQQFSQQQPLAQGGARPVSPQDEFQGQLSLGSQPSAVAGQAAFTGRAPIASEKDYGPAKYDFKWDVNDVDSGNFYGHEEERDGSLTRGRYYVRLPDSRLMTVEYYADETGYHPTITYEGEAKYDEPQRPAAPARTQAGQGFQSAGIEQSQIPLQEPQPQQQSFEPQQPFQQQPQQPFQQQPQQPFQQQPQQPFQQEPQIFEPQPQQAFQQEPQKIFQQGSQQAFQQEPQQTFQQEPQQTFQQGPQQTFQQGLQPTFQQETQQSFRPEPQQAFPQESQPTFQQEPQESFQQGPQQTFQQEPQEIFRPEPRPAFPQELPQTIQGQQQQSFDSQQSFQQVPQLTSQQGQSFQSGGFDGIQQEIESARPQFDSFGVDGSVQSLPEVIPDYDTAVTEGFATTPSDFLSNNIQTVSSVGVPLSEVANLQPSSQGGAIFQPQQGLNQVPSSGQPSSFGFDEGSAQFSDLSVNTQASLGGSPGAQGFGVPLPIASQQNSLASTSSNQQAFGNQQQSGALSPDFAGEVFPQGAIQDFSSPLPQSTPASFPTTIPQSIGQPGSDFIPSQQGAPSTLQQGLPQTSFSAQEFGQASLDTTVGIQRLIPQGSFEPVKTSGGQRGVNQFYETPSDQRAGGLAQPGQNQRPFLNPLDAPLTSDVTIQIGQQPQGQLGTTETVSGGIGGISLQDVNDQLAFDSSLGQGAAVQANLINQFSDNLGQTPLQNLSPSGNQQGPFQADHQSSGPSRGVSGQGSLQLTQLYQTPRS